MIKQLAGPTFRKMIREAAINRGIKGALGGAVVGAAGNAVGTAIANRGKPAEQKQSVIGGAVKGAVGGGVAGGALGAGSVYSQAHAKRSETLAKAMGNRIRRREYGFTGKQGTYVIGQSQRVKPQTMSPSSASNAMRAYSG